MLAPSTEMYCFLGRKCTGCEYGQTKGRRSSLGFVSAASDLRPELVTEIVSAQKERLSSWIECTWRFGNRYVSIHNACVRPCARAILLPLHTT